MTPSPNPIKNLGATSQKKSWLHPRPGWQNPTSFRPRWESLALFQVIVSKGPPSFHWQNDCKAGQGQPSPSPLQLDFPLSSSPTVEVMAGQDQPPVLPVLRSHLHFLQLPVFPRSPSHCKCDCREGPVVTRPGSHQSWVERPGEIATLRQCRWLLHPPIWALPHPPVVKMMAYPELGVAVSPKNLPSCYKSDCRTKPTPPPPCPGLGAICTAHRWLCPWANPPSVKIMAEKGQLPALPCPGVTGYFGGGSEKQL